MRSRARARAGGRRRTRLKICCIADLHEARAAIDAGADAVGLVSAMPSGPGVIDDHRIGSLLRAVPPPVECFLLTSLQSAGELVEQARRLGARTLQIVRELPIAVHHEIRETAPDLKIVQVIHVENASALERATDYAPVADALLLDSGRPNAEVEELGGTGRSHDWSISRAIVDAVDVPVFLAGGIGPENVAEAIRSVRPYGIDLCSSIRSEDRLDPARLSALVAALQAADVATVRRGG